MWGIGLWFVIAGCGTPTEPVGSGPTPTGDPSTPTPTDGPSAELCAPVEAVFTDWCVSCHGEVANAGLDLRVLSALIEQPSRGAQIPIVAGDGDLSQSLLWRKIQGDHGAIGGDGGRMPPSGVLPEPSLQAIQSWIEAGGACEVPAQPLVPSERARPDAVRLRRLNRAEYDRTVADLLGNALGLADGFPVDDGLDGFDTLGEALSTSPLHVERWEDAAEVHAEAFVARTRPGGTIRERREAEGPDVVATLGSVMPQGWMLWSNGSLTGTFTFPISGEYVITAQVYSTPAPPDPARMSVSVGDVVVGTFDVPNQNTPLAYEVTVPVQAGEHPISVAFLNDAMNPDGADRNLMVDAIELRLANAPSDDAAYERFRDGLTCSPATAPACLDAFFGTLLPVAYRRPVPATELSALTGRIQGWITQEGFTAEEAWVGGIQSVLLSPNFLFRPEFSGGALNDHELATRLSYLIWGTMPDDTLRAHADAGELTDPVVLEAEARRMFNDPRASALVDDFAGQWLWLRRIAGASPDPAVYPDTEALLPDFADEARLLVHRAFFENTVDALLTDSVIEVNPELASYYGVPAPLDGWQLVDLGGVGRVGILTNGGLLAALSNPSTTNPVRRGKWMLNQLLCEEPGDPPPGAIDSFDPQVGTGSLRDRLAQHRADPACASCHDTLDPLGFGFEAYGAGGEWRTLDDLGEPVDESGTLPGGRTFEGPMGLGAHLADDPRFALCVSEKLYTYGVGTTMSPENHPYVREASGRFVREGLVFEELLVGIVLSDGFRERRP